MLLNTLRTEILIIGPDDPRQLILGFIMYEKLGTSNFKNTYYYICY